jgi:hypothetical protein
MEHNRIAKRIMHHKTRGYTQKMGEITSRENVPEAYLADDDV